MEPAKRVAINTGILYARMGITVLISLYATRLILEALGVEDFGLFNVVGGAIAMLGFLNASMSAATQRYMSFAQGAGDLRKMNQIFNVSVILHFIIAALLFLILQLAGYFFFDGILNISVDRIGSAKLVYQFMIISTIFTVISVPYNAVITARENMLLFAILGIIESILKLGIAIYITYTLHDKLVIYGFSMAGLSIFLLLLSGIYCHKKYVECKIDLSRQFDKKLMKEMTGFAGWSSSGSVSGMLAQYGQVIVMNMFFGPAVNASQGIANQVSGQLGVFGATMMKALNPVIAKSEGAKNRSYMLKASMFGSKAAFFLLMIFIIPVLIEMPLIFNFWLKDVPEYTIIFCRLLLVRDLMGQLFVPLKSSISAVGNIKKFNLFYSIVTILPIGVSCFLFSFNYPPESLYYVFLVYEVVISSIIIYFAKVECKLPILFFLKNVIWRCGLTFIVAIFFSSMPIFIFEDEFIRLLAVFLTSSISVIICIWLIGLTSEERKIILNNLFYFLNKIRRKVAQFQY